MTPAISRRWILVGAGASVALAPVARAQAREEFRIGAIASLTGPASAFSKDWADGFQTYVRAWNARGGPRERRVTVDLLDDETNPVNAVNAFRRLVADNRINVIWVALASQTALGIKAVSGEFKVPVISGGGVDELGRPAAPWFFKIAPAGSDYIKAVVEFAKSRGYKSIASLHATDAIGQADLKYLRQFSEAAGIKLAVSESFALSDTNFNAQLVNIRNAKPDLVYNGATGNPAILVFKQVKQLDLTAPMVLSQAAISAAFFTAVGGREQVEGNYSVISIGALAAEVGGDTARLFGDLSAALGKPAQLFHTFGWDTGILTEWALANSDGSRQGIRDALEKARELPAINGPLTFTAEDHIGQDTRGLVMAQFKDGKWRKVN